MTQKECIDALKKYGNMVMRIALNYLKNKYDAEDIVQNVFLKLIKGMPDFKDEEHLKRWLIRVTINECKSVLITPWHKKTSFLEDIDKREDTYKNDEKNELYEIVMNLPRKYRIPIYLYYYEGYSAKEISVILKIKEATVRAQLMRARNKIKKELKEENDYESKEEI